MKTPKKKSRSQLVKQADKLFKLSVRLRDADNDGYVRCISCDKRLHWKDCHGGHFMSARFYATRWDEENVNAQCAYCNTYLGGDSYHYGLNLDLKYGTGTAKKLSKQAKAGVGQKFPSSQIEQIILDAQEQIAFYEKGRS